MYKEIILLQRKNDDNVILSLFGMCLIQLCLHLASSVLDAGCGVHEKWVKVGGWLKPIKP